MTNYLSNRSITGSQENKELQYICVKTIEESLTTLTPSPRYFSYSGVWRLVSYYSSYFFFSLIIYKNAKKFTCLQTPKPESLSCITFSHTEHLTSVEINSNQCEY